MGCYAEYRESGVGWLGELPSHWELRRISALYDARNEKVSDQDYPPLSVTMQGIVPQLETAAKTQDGDNRKLVRTGDFVINSRSDRRGACGISEYDGSVTLISNVLAPKDRSTMSTRYYSYLFRSEGFADEFYRQGTGIVDDLWSTNWTRMKNILVARPPLAEQERIADYLDAKTTEIDALVADCEREVELLQEYRKSVISEAVTKGLDPTVPMKDSGIEWIGEIPKYWNLARVKQVCCKVTDGSHFSPPIVEDGYPYITATNIHGRGIDYESAKLIDEQSYTQLEKNGCRPKSGDVLMVKDGATTGRVGLMVDNEPCVILSSVALMRPTTICNSDYLFFFLQSNSFQVQVLVSMAGSAMPRTTLDKLVEYFVVLPPSTEQRAITNYLDTKTAEIDALIKDKQTMADKLREYRKSLISEAVTGKFKVPGI